MCRWSSYPKCFSPHLLKSILLKSSYSSETSLGANLAGTVVYAWSFSSNISEALENGLLLGHRKFLGDEQLQLTFTGSLAANIQVDVFAFCQSVLEQGGSYVKVRAL